MLLLYSLGFAPLRQLRQICRAVPTATFQMLVVALVHSRLNYSNAVLVGIRAYLVCHLQSVHNAAARLIYHLRQHDHISDALPTQHWSRIPEHVQYEIAVLTFKVCISFKLAVLTYRAIHGAGPSYFQCCFTRVSRRRHAVTTTTAFVRL